MFLVFTEQLFTAKDQTLFYQTKLLITAKGASLLPTEIFKIWDTQVKTFEHFHLFPLETGGIGSAIF